MLVSWIKFYLDGEELIKKYKKKNLDKDLQMGYKRYFNEKNLDFLK